MWPSRFRCKHNQIAKGVGTAAQSTLMKKSRLLTRLLLLLLLGCFCPNLSAQDIAITGYEPNGEYNGAPLFELSETIIEVRRSDYSTFWGVYVDDNCVLNSYYEDRHTIDVSQYNDGTEHKLSLSVDTRYAIFDLRMKFLRLI